MIKVCKLKTILKVLLIIIISILVLLFSKKYFVKETIKTSNTANNTTYKILVDVEDSKLFLFENDKLIKTYKCSGGTWTIISKAKWGEGFRTEVLWELMFHGGNLEYMEL